MAKKKVRQMPVAPRKSPELLVTQRNLEATKAALMSELTTHRLETKAGFVRLEAQISEVKTMAHKILAL